MQEYKNKNDLINEISKWGELFVNEFSDIKELDKDVFFDGVDRTPSQMISYQLGWLNLILRWEKDEQQGVKVITPHPDYKWNNLGGLYNSFYKQYENYSLEHLTNVFKDEVQRIIQLVESFSDDELFQQGKRYWASSTPSNWPIWKWIHINTVAPFKTFRTKIRKWKKIKKAFGK